MKRRSALDNPDQAAFAWARFRRMMKAMAWIAAAVVIAVLGAFFYTFGFISVHFYIASALGIGAMIMLTAALMGLVFLSSGTGHDEAIEDPLDPGED